VTKYRPHRGSLDKAMAEVVEVADFPALVAHMRKTAPDWYPPEELPTVENTTVEPYGDSRTRWDSRIGWNTHVVKVNGSVWGFTDGPLERRTTGTVSQRGLIRAKNYILHEINTIEEEGINRNKPLEKDATWYGIDRMCAIRDMAAQIVDGKEPNISEVYGGPPEDFDDENSAYAVSSYRLQMKYTRTPERGLIEDALIQANGILVTIKAEYQAAGRSREAARIGSKIALIQAALQELEQ
jgi:hypothetical protein